MEDKAVVFEKANVNDLKDKLQDCCRHPEKVMNLKQQVSDYICNKYDWNNVVTETIKLYK